MVVSPSPARLSAAGGASEDLGAGQTRPEALIEHGRAMWSQLS
jgi:hypothetical protein